MCFKFVLARCFCEFVFLVISRGPLVNVTIETIFVGVNMLFGSDSKEIRRLCKRVVSRWYILEVFLGNVFATPVKLQLDYGAKCNLIPVKIIGNSVFRVNVQERANRSLVQRLGCQGCSWYRYQVLIFQSA